MTSPNVDRICAQGVRFTNCYASDAPCLPRRTALFSGRCGFHTGVVNHGGVAAQPFVEGANRAFKDWYGQHAWPMALRHCGLHTVASSPFGERHSAWHWNAGFNEIHNTGESGHEIAPTVASEALEWLQRRGRRKPWFMHLNFWDPHTPYRTPDDFGNPFDRPSDSPRKLRTREQR